jgi:Mce-associated membrane protein
MTTLNEDVKVETIDEELDSATEGAHQESETTETEEPSTEAQPKAERTRRRIGWPRVFAYGILPGLALVLALGAGYLKWSAGAADDLALARTESVQAAREDAIALLSYHADTVDKDLAAARERLTGEFKDAYGELTRQVVVPGAKEKHISSVAKVNAAASVSASETHAVALVYVDQTVTIGAGAPTDTQPVVRMTLDKVNGRWLVSRFDPV